MAVASTAEKIVCPKCGFEQYKRSAICKKCGLIFDKWREAQSKRGKSEKGDKKADDKKEKAQAAGDAGAVPNVGARRLVMLILLIIAVGLIGYRMYSQQGRVATSTPPATTSGGG